VTLPDRPPTRRLFCIVCLVTRTSRAALVVAVRACLLAKALLACFACLVAHAQPLSGSRDMDLRVGDQASLSAQGVKSFSEGMPGIVEVRLPKDGEQFVLLALRPGNTTLLLFMLDGREQQVRMHVTSDLGPPTGEQIRVAAQDNIRLDFYFVQVSQGYGHQLGIGYPDSVGGNATLKASMDLRSGGITDASLGIADQVLPRLDIAQRAGFAKVSRQAAVVAENGKQAAFRSGGEINVAIQGALTAEVRSIQYGSQVTVQPRFDKENNRIELQVGAEVSDLTHDTGAIPGRSVATLDTVVNLDLGKSLVLAGLNASSDSKSSTGLPGLSRIPILGGLFGSRARRSEETKNLLFIVPSVVQAVPLRERTLIDEMLRMYQQFEGDMAQAKLLEPGTRAAPQSHGPPPHTESSR